MKKIVMMAVVAFSFVALSAGMNGTHAGLPPLKPQIAEKIGLSAEVQEKIKQIEQNARATIKDLQQKTKTAMEKQAKLMAESKPDEGAVMAAINELFDLRKEMAKAQTKRILAVKALLTPEQLEKALEEMKKAREEHHAKKGEGHKGKHHGGKGKHAQPPAEAK